MWRDGWSVPASLKDACRLRSHAPPTHSNVSMDTIEAYETVGGVRDGSRHASLRNAGARPRALRVSPLTPTGDLTVGVAPGRAAPGRGSARSAAPVDRGSARSRLRRVGSNFDAGTLYQKKRALGGLESPGITKTQNLCTRRAEQRKDYKPETRKKPPTQTQALDPGNPRPGEVNRT